MENKNQANQSNQKIDYENFTTTLKKTGTSICVIIPSNIIEVLNLKLGQLVKITLEVPNLENQTLEEIKTIRCSCGAVFNDSKKDVYDCISCDVSILASEGEIEVGE